MEREWFTQALKIYYVVMLELTEEGLPPRELVRELGLDGVIPVLEPLKGTG